MMTERKVVGIRSPVADDCFNLGGLALLAVFDGLRGAVTAPAAVGVPAGLAGDLAGLEARARDAGLRAGVVMHSGYHHQSPVVANLAGRLVAMGRRPV